ncbi:hypothetical protein [Agromyces archimandritae]|uniref:Uncharacterized protein n=1 Tax=Agromyces archimandritae TaxID=2781962 RepID=A0A975IPT4_9MICO|nr:hypothetical protein [Agromyces archimandritae]QTX05978.1 hypothetical protein G127AT_07300 [Agromyces archimandritae]
MTSGADARGRPQVRMPGGIRTTTSGVLRNSVRGEDVRRATGCKAEEESLTGGEADDDNAANGRPSCAAARAEFRNTP